MKRFFRFFVLAFCLAGCSASGPKFQDTSFATLQVASDKGRIIFYRHSDTHFRSVTLGIDGSIVGALNQQGFIVADTVPGDHRVSAWVRYTPTGEFAINTTLSAGETRYIRVAHRSHRMLYPFVGPLGAVLFFADTEGEFRLEPVPATIALPALVELKLSE